MSKVESPFESGATGGAEGDHGTLSDAGVLGGDGGGVGLLKRRAMDAGAA